MSKRHRLSPRELELVLAGLLILVNEAEEALSDEAQRLAERLAQSRPGRAGREWSEATHRLWVRASRLAEAKRR